MIKASTPVCKVGWITGAKRGLWLLQRAIRLSPLDPQRWLFFLGISFAHLVARRFEEVVDCADRCLREQPRMTHVYRFKAVACAHLGR
ncbi:MAG: hypothetical protein JO320_21770, partial [Alphaproteobacteria bacterium]|nr:hypothetical protein [Alphaproteobacteria bacterium]